MHRTTLACAVVVALACGGSGGDKPQPPDLAAQLATLQGKAVFFGHQSVGANIVSGLEALLSTNPGAKPVVVQTTTPDSLHAGVFAHGYVPANEHPDQKIAEFRTLMAGALGAKADLAFLKFCYVDFQGGTSDATLDTLFRSYQDMVAAVHAANPQVKLLHLTVPLSPSDDPNNAIREKWSAKIRAAYGDDVFDLARVESTAAGTRAQRPGTYGPRLVDDWKSDDSGHLNATGGREVARALVAFLAGR